MSVEERLRKKILTAGSLGIKKTDLRKDCEGADLDEVLEKLITKGDVYVDKKGAAYHCWHKDHYLQNLLNSDPSFKVTYNAIKSLEESINSSIEALAGNISNLAKLVVEKGNDRAPQAKAVAVQTRTMSADEFRNEFDLALASCSSSIGWVELAKIKTVICSKYRISGEEFYRLASQLTSQYQDKYELSTGGGEGVVVRGLLHGFVRCI